MIVGRIFYDIATQREKACFSARQRLAEYAVLSPLCIEQG
jgi:hypothetical protein